MRVIVVEPYKKISVKEIDNDISAWQKIVGGYVECHTLSDGCMVMCDEEGRCKGYKPCCTINGKKFVGTIFITHADEKNVSETRDLNDKEIVLYRYGNKIK